MQWYGSFQNRLIENTNSQKLEIGMGVTECLWSDRHAWEIVEIKDDRHITIRRMVAIRKDGTDWFDQEYDLYSEPTERTINLFKTKNNGWRERIGKNGLGCTKFSIGHADEYYDPSF